MTAEIAIMNRYAVVLAADSATTVTYWVQGKRSERYFKGANKLFQLSEHRPVGLMIFNSAAIHGVPWEIVVKEFRRTLGEEGLPHLADYSQRFAEFVKAQAIMFPDELRKKALVQAASAAAYQIVRGIKEAISRGEPDSPQTIATQLDAERARLTAETLPICFTAADVDAAVAAHIAEVEAMTTADALLRTNDQGQFRQLAELAIRRAIVGFKELVAHTGVVIAGYGEQEFFPSFKSFDCYGFLDSHFLWLEGSLSAAIGANKTAVIEPFATTSMINTFQMGISPDVYSKVVAATKKSLTEFADTLRASSDVIGPVQDVSGLIEDAAKAHQKSWFYPSLDTHYDALARVVGSLPVTDMAALAKSLIELESLKERVTEPSESVAGPTDVAVISKHDGFVWIERKHYFKPELNPRFSARYK